MLVFTGVLTALLIAAATVSFLEVLFSREISTYLKAKTDELKAITEILRKERKEDA